MILREGRGSCILAIFIGLLQSLQTSAVDASCGASDRSCMTPAVRSDEISLLQTQALVSAHRASTDDETGNVEQDDKPPTVIWKPAPAPSPPAESASSWSTIDIDPAPTPTPQSAAPAPPPPTVYQPEHNGCTPQCTWKCASAKCDEVCAPVCKTPQCQTRCKGFNTKSCHMECQKPHCAVVCPKRICPKSNCPKCKTSCSKPMCKMKCNADEQPCRNVCAQPDCKWQCKAPLDCPKPSCKMVCETPKNCLASISKSKEIPALEPGESDVKCFEAPDNLNLMLSQAEAGKVPSFRVPISTMEEGARVTRHVELPLVQDTGVAVGADTFPRLSALSNDAVELMQGRRSPVDSFVEGTLSDMQ